MTLLIGFSRLKAWRRCHRLHNYQYRQFLRRRKPRVQLLRGTILHEMLDARAKGENALNVLVRYGKEYSKLFLEEQEEYGDLIGDCRKIFLAYCAAYEKDGLTVVASEQEVRVQLDKDVQFKGTIDRVLLDKRTKNRWVLDSKSHKNIPGEEVRFSDLQTVFYIWAWNEKNARRQVTGIIWDYLRTKLPAVPEVLKSGKLSQRANIDTTYAVAFQAVKEHCNQTGESPANYTEWLEGLKGREEKFLKRVYLPNPPKVMIDTLVREMRVTANQMLSDLDDDTRTLTKDCSWCSFRDLCHAELRGQDADFIRKTEFVVDEEASEDYAEED